MDKTLKDRIIITKGDITTFKVDAIVNAANSTLLGGGGVDGAIHRKGGTVILKECKEIRQHRYPKGLPQGKAVITTAGSLPCKNVIHTVGPIWRGGSSGEKKVLAAAYRNCLTLAGETGIKSIAFPAISTGVYSFPGEIAAPIVFKTIRDYLTKKSLPREVYLVFYSESDRKCFLSNIDRYSQVNG